ncbi:uncharacterized protein METZ01_LOCUS402865, partial [marine metagenome]
RMWIAFYSVQYLARKYAGEMISIPLDPFFSQTINGNLRTTGGDHGLNG